MTEKSLPQRVLELSASYETSALNAYKTGHHEAGDVWANCAAELAGLVEQPLDRASDDVSA